MNSFLSMEIRSLIIDIFKEAFAERGLKPPLPFAEDLVLLSSGLDSIGFATIVTDLDARLGYDPFVLMEEPVYPRTFGEFVSIYERFSDRRSS